MVVLERMVDKIWYSRIKQAREGADAEDVANWFKQSDSSRNPYVYREIPQELIAFFLYAMQKIEEFTGSQPIQYMYMDALIQFLKDSSRRADERVFSAITELLTFSSDKVKTLKDYEKRVNELEEKKDTLNEAKKAELAQLVEVLNAYKTENQILINGPIQLKISEYMDTLEELQNKLFPEYISMYNEVLEFDTVFEAVIRYSIDDPDNKDLYSSIYTAIFENLNSVKRDANFKKTMDFYLQQLMILYASNSTVEYGLPLGKDKAKIGWSDILLRNLPNYARFFPDNYDGYTILDTTVLTAFRNYIELQPDPTVRTRMTSTFVRRLNDIKGILANVNTVTDLYDHFHNFAYNNTQPFPTQKFRTDFDKKSGLFKEFTDEQYDAVGTCCFKQAFNFSSFLNLVREKQTKQDAIDSLHTLAPACKTEFIAVGLIPSPEITIDLKDTSEEVIKQQQKRVMDAIQKGDLEEFKKVAGSIKLDFTNETGETPVHLAIELGKSEILPYLLPIVSLSIKDKHGDTPLLHAIKKSNVEIVKLFASLGNRAELQVKDTKGLSARQIVEAMPESDARKAMLDSITLLERTSGDVVLKNLSKETVPAMVNQPASAENITAGSGMRQVFSEQQSRQLDFARPPVIPAAARPPPVPVPVPAVESDQGYLARALQYLPSIGLGSNTNDYTNGIVARRRRGGGGNQTHSHRTKYAKTRKQVRKTGAS